MAATALVVPETTAKAEIVTLLKTTFLVLSFFVFQLLDKLAESAEEASCSWEIFGQLEVRLPAFLWSVLTDFVVALSAHVYQQQGVLFEISAAGERAKHLHAGMRSSVSCIASRAVTCWKKASPRTQA